MGIRRGPSRTGKVLGVPAFAKASAYVKTSARQDGVAGQRKATRRLEAGAPAVGTGLSD